MRVTDKQVAEIVKAVALEFRTFGAGQTSQYNPVVNALQDHQPMFAMGVDVQEVVRFVLKRALKGK